MKKLLFLMGFTHIGWIATYIIEPSPWAWVLIPLNILAIGILWSEKVREKVFSRFE